MAHLLPEVRVTAEYIRIGMAMLDYDNKQALILRLATTLYAFVIVSYTSARDLQLKVSESAFPEASYGCKVQWGPDPYMWIGGDIHCNHMYTETTISNNIATCIKCGAHVWISVL